MTRITTRLACAALLIGGLAPLLAGCDEPHQAVASAPAQTSEPEVSVVTVAPKARAVVRELPGRIAPTRVADVDRKSTRLNSSHAITSRMPSSA